MNETQCAVFQGIVYYYRANQVICRYQIALHDPVDPALLQRALDEVRPLAGWYFQKVVWEKREAHLAPNDAPCRVTVGEAAPAIPEATNDYLFSLHCEGTTIYFDWFHFLADGRGFSPFMTLVLRAYCNLRYGTAFACETLAEDPPYDPELLLKEFPESQKAGAEQNQPIDIFEGKPDRIRLRLDRASLIEAAAREGVKPFTALMGIVCQGCGQYLEKDELLYSFAADLRETMSLPNARYNCIVTYQLPLKGAAGARLSAFAKALDAAIREHLKPERLRYRLAEQMGFVCRVFQQKAPLKIKQRIFQMGEYLSGSPADFWVSYLGDPFAPRSPELEAYVEDFQTWVLPDGASLAMEVTSLHGVLTACIENKVHRPGLAQALAHAFAAEGVTVLEAAELDEQ